MTRKITRLPVGALGGCPIWYSCLAGSADGHDATPNSAAIARSPDFSGFAAVARWTPLARLGCRPILAGGPRKRFGGRTAGGR
jgi:hypothetical protein